MTDIVEDVNNTYSSQYILKTTKQFRISSNYPINSYMSIFDYVPANTIVTIFDDSGKFIGQNEFHPNFFEARVITLGCDFALDNPPITANANKFITTGINKEYVIHLTICIYYFDQI